MGLTGHIPQAEQREQEVHLFIPDAFFLKQGKLQRIGMRKSLMTSISKLFAIGRTAMKFFLL